MKKLLHLVLFLLICACTAREEKNIPLEYTTEVITAHRIHDKAALDTGFAWTQARAAVVPANPPYAVMTISQKFSGGSDVYFDLYETLSYDTGKTWTAPEVIPSLKIHEVGNGYRRSMSDMTPQWHKATDKVLNIGKSFYYTDNATPDRSKREVAYAVLNPETKQWSEYRTLELPQYDHDSLLLSAPVAGCVQWLEMENGEVLIPISYRKLTPVQATQTTREDFDVDNNMKNNDLGGAVTVLRCSFDGEKLTYLNHGTELTQKDGRGLGEPSITYFQGEYFLTIRQDKTAYVTKSSNGLQYAPIQEWVFDDGSLLGSYNTQQHWATHSEKLFLVYTRKGANNDHVFRHRAPLFMAEVDPEKMQVIRATERILIPDGGIGLGNFGVTEVSKNESWVVTTEYYRGEQDSVDNEVFVAKISWNKPNGFVKK